MRYLWKLDGMVVRQVTLSEYHCRSRICLLISEMMNGQNELEKEVSESWESFR
jgi:hypothetical protein